MKHYTIDGKTCDKLPDPCHGVSPMTEERFIALGGTITDDGEPTPEERVRGAFANLIRARENVIRYGSAMTSLSADPAAELDRQYAQLVH